MRISEQALNRLNLLKTIRREGPIARRDLPALTGLSTGSVSSLTAALLERGLIVEHREPRSGAGRPRSPVEVNAQGAIVIGASVSIPNVVNTCFVDLAGKELFSHQAEQKNAPTLSGIAHEYAACIEQAIVASGIDRARIVRAGLAIPAVVNSGTGMVHYMVTFPVAEPVPFAELIAAELKIPVTIENDTGSLARAEHWFGEARTCSDFAWIDVSLALGLAEYRNGLPHVGTNGLNPELGHTKIDRGNDAPACYCGGRGCLTLYCTGYGLLNHFGQWPTDFARLDQEVSSNLKAMMDRAQTDPTVRAFIDEGGERLGTAIGNFINLTDPGKVFVSFDQPDLRRMMNERLLAAVDASVMPGFRQGNSVTLLDRDSGWRSRGTAALALEQTYLGQD